MIRAPRLRLGAAALHVIYRHEYVRRRESVKTLLMWVGLDMDVEEDVEERVDTDVEEGSIRMWMSGFRTWDRQWTSGVR